MPFRFRKPIYIASARRRRMRRRRRITHRKPGYHVPRAARHLGGEYYIRKIRFALGDGDGHSMSSTSGALSTDYVYRCNGLYDPYAGAGGTQPRCFDQIMAMYRNFVVLGSKLTLFLGFGAASSTSADMQVVTVVRDGSTAITDAKDALEAGRMRTRLLTAGQDNKRLTHTWSYKLAGNKAPLDNDNLWGTSAADPTEQFYYHILAWQPGGGSDSIHFTGYIDYTAIFFHSIQPSAS